MTSGFGPILIWGAGAIGGTIGAVLRHAGHDVRFVDIVPEHVAAIRAGRLHVSGPVHDLTVAAPAALPHEVDGRFALILLAVKAHHTEAAKRGAVVVGELDGSSTDRIAALHRLLQAFDPDAVLSDNIFGYLWGKAGYG